MRMNRRVPRRVARLRDDESGLVLVWLAMVMIVLLGMGALAVDVAHLHEVKTSAQKAADAAALAGAVSMPDAPNQARADATSIASKNGFSNDSNTTVTVDPGSAATERQVTVTVRRTVSNFLAGVLGIDTSDVTATATADYDRPVEEVRTPIDIVMILDRTQSLDSGEFNTVKTAANSVLTSVFDPTLGDHVALGLLGPSRTSSTCSNGAYGTAAATSGTSFQGPLSWVVAPFPWAAPAADYRNANSQIRRTITCMTQNPGTDLSTPVAQATTYLNSWARPTARKVIMLMTDGFPQPPTGSGTNTADPYTCRAAVNSAAGAKAAGITVVTIGYGVGGGGTSNNCRDASTTWTNRPVSAALATMASPVNGVAANDNCSNASVENSDGDNFFCGASSSELVAAFQSGATTIIGDPARPRLIK
jgi:Flp pilus assembly protein TadG